MQAKIQGKRGTFLTMLSFTLQNQERFASSLTVLSNIVEIHWMTSSHRGRIGLPCAIQVGEVSQRFSCWYKPKKFVAWIQQFKSGTREARRRGIALHWQESQFSQSCWRVKECWKSNNPSSSSSKFRWWAPILVLVVAYRIRQFRKGWSILPYCQKITTSPTLSWATTTQSADTSGLSTPFIRENYWIMQARVLFCCILSSCIDCRKRQAVVGQ